MGLAIPLDQFSFHLNTEPNGEPSIQIAFDPQLSDEAESWRFFRLRVGPIHPLAVALRCRGGAEVALSVREAGPLLDAR
jgi:hypothetical protein